MPISVMLKPASGNCNLRCEYCFYHDLAATRQTENKGYMTRDTALQVMDKALAFAGDGPVYFTFQGGEPLLAGKDFFRFFFSSCKERQRPGVTVQFCVQTNGTLLDDEWCDLFLEYGCLVGVSLDGDREGNRYRVYPDGRSSFDDVFRGVQLLTRRRVPFNILSVLTAYGATHVRSSYRFFKQQGLRHLQYIPCLRPFAMDAPEDLFMTDDDYAAFLQQGFKLYANDALRGNPVSVRMFDNYLLLARGQNAEQCGMNGTCATQFVVEADGSTYPCDFYCTDDWYLGNICAGDFDGFFHSEKMVEFLKNSFQLPPACKTCCWFTLCRGGGCKRNRVGTDYCRAYQTFLQIRSICLLNCVEVFYEKDDFCTAGTGTDGGTVLCLLEGWQGGDDHGCACCLHPGLYV